MLSRFLPTHGPTKLDEIRSRTYVSQFSADGSLFVAGFQVFFPFVVIFVSFEVEEAAVFSSGNAYLITFISYQRSQIRVYNVEKDWKVQKDIMAKSLRWTITDTCLSPDQRFLVSLGFYYYISHDAWLLAGNFLNLLRNRIYILQVYSSMSPLVHIVNIQSATTESLANITEIHDGLNFSVDDNDDEDEISIFSVKFSTDGRELVAASGDGSIYVYDLGANKLNIRITAHLSDVNTVCFADESGNLIYSGSDDKLCKVSTKLGMVFGSCIDTTF
ncbi:hypothetical protein CRG98_010877 [Punica granatum]|uniref:Uncharacterized protein n=1 Tax=Punica granatum TaxID=22663 RepID=A0A2I0KKI5_PUNGR|nr:hypothetical protein CRG98_010877 [Punica granatum]